MTQTSGKGKLANGRSSGETVNDEQISQHSPIPNQLSPPSTTFTTTFYLAYPPSHSSSLFRRIKPRLVVQLLQQAATKKRLQPVFEVLLAASVALRYGQKDVHCRSDDLALVQGDFYSDCILPDGSRAEYSDDEGEEDEPGGKAKVMAVIRDQRKIQAKHYRQGQNIDEGSGPAKFFFSCGAIWEAITAQNGNHYQLVAVDSEQNKVNGDYKLMSWTREHYPHEGKGSESESDVRFRLSIVDGNFRDMPLVATVTKRSIQVAHQTLRQDGLRSPFSSRSSLLLQSTSRGRSQSPSKSDSPFGSLDTPSSDALYLLCLVLTSAVWVASSEGWLPI